MTMLARFNFLNKCKIKFLAYCTKTTTGLCNTILSVCMSLVKIFTLYHYSYGIDCFDFFSTIRMGKQLRVACYLLS